MNTTTKYAVRDWYTIRATSNAGTGLTLVSYGVDSLEEAQPNED